MIEKLPPFATCGDCDSQLQIRVWGEGVDSEIECTECDNKEIYR